MQILNTLKNSGWFTAENAFHLLNSLAGLMVLIVGILYLVFGSFKSFVLGVYMIMFAVVLVASDIKNFPPLLLNFPFLQTAYGRAFTYWFLAWFIIAPVDFDLAAGIITMLVAIAATAMAYFQMEYPLPMIEAMREVDGNGNDKA
jgi:hypothetical protein